MGTTVLHEAWRAGVQKYITLMGGCSYPAQAPSPIKETELWEGYPQPESAPYSLAKAMSSLQAAAYRRQYGFNAIVLVPGNLYGPYDNFDLKNSHVIPALIRKVHEAKRNGADEIVMWGSGKPVRDFVYVKDACHAILLAAERYNGSDLINLSSGAPVTIKELVDTVVALCGYQGRVRWDSSKPDGQMLKGFDVTRMREWLGIRQPFAVISVPQWFMTLISRVADALGFLGCGTPGDPSDTGGNPALQYPGACVCFDGSGYFRSCVVTANYQTCLSTVTTCNPFFYTNFDCSHWCPSSPLVCP